MTRSVEPTGGEPELIDWSAALETALGDRELLWEVVEAFLQEAPEAMERVRGAVAACQAKPLRYWAHRLCGQLRPFVCAATAALAAELQGIGARLAESEAAWPEQDVQRAGELVALVDQQLARILAAMREAFRARRLPDE